MIQNRDDREWCTYCGNTGWATLLGTVREMGIDYTRGSTPCRWCILGAEAWKQFADRPAHEQPLSLYTEADVDMVGPRPSGRRDPQAAEKLYALMRMVAAGKPVHNPPPWVIVERRHREAAALALEQLAAEQKQEAPT